MTLSCSWHEYVVGFWHGVVGIPWPRTSYPGMASLQKQSTEIGSAPKTLSVPGMSRTSSVPAVAKTLLPQGFEQAGCPGGV